MQQTCPIVKTTTTTTLDKIVCRGFQNNKSFPFPVHHSLVVRGHRTEASMEGISQSISKLLRPSGKGRSDEKKQNYSSDLPEGLCRRFSLGEIKKATNDFADDLVIGERSEERRVGKEC